MLRLPVWDLVLIGDPGGDLEADYTTFLLHATVCHVFRIQHLSFSTPRTQRSPPSKFASSNSAILMEQGSSNIFLPPDFASPLSAADRASLEGLSKDEIQAWALRKSEEYRLLSYDMLSLHNAAAPIHTLPVELLRKIFSMTWTQWSRKGLRPISVCRRWRTVYLATTEFWAEALAALGPTFIERGHHGGQTFSISDPGYSDMRPPPQFATMLLDRSWPCPIKLHARWEALRGAPILPTQFVLHTTVFPHPIHVVGLTIATTLLYLHDLYRVLNVGIPALEELDVRAREMEPPDLVRTLLTLPPVPDGNLPCLRILHLDPAIFFPLVAVRALENVYLGSAQGEDAPWTHPAESESRSLIRVLSRCHKLESLHLEAYERSRWWPPLGDGASGTVQLPSLKKLSFGSDIETVEAYAHSVLAALDPCIPSTASVHRGPLTPDWPDNLPEFMPDYLVEHHPFDTVILSIATSYPRGRKWSIHCLAGGSPRLEVWFKATQTLGELGIEHVFRTAHVTHLEIIQDFRTHPRSFTRTSKPSTLVDDWAATLRAFPHLTHLTVRGADTPDAVVDVLGADAGHSHSELLASGRPLCPALRYVTVGWRVPREIVPEEADSSCDPATYRKHQDVGPRVEQRCSVLQLAFERRTSMKAQGLHALEFYEYELRGDDAYGVAGEFGELISGSRRDDSDLPCLERLREVVGGPVVYRGYLLKTAVERQWNANI
ncbi:hypothetical protein GSI_04693 [Ganoderma sinense ZZ0214-1]|uniref:F-box domain-containing protein n=1 Tax=Ganoderma sinense ZZ0214-1 TaxID=1077348 RepID=A0A2G8SHK0_9APHY|nr:hypothetical protein GSI_04693 [Ganoderma sinense ZZ0214-1]